ncbi:MAG: glycosyltransferase family 39 protein [Anaerolineales bacterium]|nr:glycosyltransferase family 39 protein [Anaerolineales bacterium]
MSSAPATPRPRRRLGLPVSFPLFTPAAFWLAVALTGLAALLRLYRLDNQAIWWDEGFSVFLARMPLVEMAAATAHDTHPLGYYTLLHLWRLPAGDSAVAMRLPSVLAGVLLGPLVYRLVRPLAGKRAALAALALVALNRLLIWYAQEVRQYAVAAALALASLVLAVALWRAAESPQPRRPAWLLWFGCVAVNTAGLLTLYLFVSALLAQNGAFLLALWRAPRKARLALWWLSAQAAVALACLPWLLYYLPRAPHTFLPPSTLDALGVLQLYLAALFAGDASDISRFWLVSGVGLLVLGLGLLAALRRGQSSAARGFTALALLLGAAAPPALIWLLNLPTGLGLSFVPNPRYFVLLAPWALAGVAVALALPLGAARRWSGRVALAALALFWLGYLAQYYHERYLVDDFASAAATLAAQRQPGDAVVLENDQNWPVAAYHLGGRDWLGLNSGRAIAAEADAALAVGAAWEAHSGLWLLVTPEALSSDPARMVYGWLAERALAVRVFDNAPGSRLYFFARTPERAATVDALAAAGNPTQPGARASLRLNPAPGLTLTRVEWLLPEVRPGDTLRVFLYWQNDHAPGLYQFEARLITLLGGPADAWPLALVITPDSPAVLRQQVDLPVRAYVGPGPYWLSLAAGPAQGRLGLVNVAAAPAPPPVRSAPAVAQPVLFEQGLQLLGYTSRLDPGRLTLTPYWTTSAPVDTRYKFFAHVFGAALNPATGTALWAQLDREPGFGATPVTTWRVGQTVTDQFAFDLPPGQYTVRLGWYDAFTGERLLVLDPGGAPLASEVVLGPFILPPPTTE